MKHAFDVSAVLLHYVFETTWRMMIYERLPDLIPANLPKSVAGDQMNERKQTVEGLYLPVFR